MTNNCGDVLEPKDLVTVQRVKPLWGVEVGPGRQFETTLAVEGGYRKVSLDTIQVWHPWDEHEAHREEYQSEDPEFTLEHGQWSPGKLPGRVCGVARAATTSLASIVDSSSPLSDAQLLSCANHQEKWRSNWQETTPDKTADNTRLAFIRVGK